MNITRRDFLASTGVGALSFSLNPNGLEFRNDESEKPGPPNILWIYVEDLSPLMSCYGVTINKTPNLDRLAGQGVRFAKAFIPAPVCSPCRSAIITGTMATTLGLHNHHSSRTQDSAIYLPEGVKTIPELFKKAGYFTFNKGKDDYNFWYDRNDLYYGRYKEHPLYGKTGIEGDWTDRRDGQPFFGQIQLSGGKLVYRKNFKERVTDPMDPDTVDLPPYYADHPVMRKEWADHLDAVRLTDQEVGEILARLKKDGLLENTVIFFFSDHGMRAIRHKQFCYEGGIHVPMIVAWLGNPQKLKSGTVREDLVSGIDIGTTSLALAGIDIPPYMEGRDMFAADYKPREYIIAARDRCDFTIDRIRAVRTDRYKYIRNFMTDRSYMQPNYRDHWESTKLMKRLYAEGKLNQDQAPFMSSYRPEEELYDLGKDPHEVHNLAKDPEFAPVLKHHRQILEQWIKETDDQGQYPEGREGLKFMLERWGDRCVNPEYDPIRKQEDREEP